MCEHLGQIIILLIIVYTPFVYTINIVLYNTKEIKIFILVLFSVEKIVKILNAYGLVYKLLISCRCMV